MVESGVSQNELSHYRALVALADVFQYQWTAVYPQIGIEVWAGTFESLKKMETSWLGRISLAVIDNLTGDWGRAVDYVLNKVPKVAYVGSVDGAFRRYKPGGVWRVGEVAQLVWGDQRQMMDWLNERLLNADENRARRTFGERLAKLSDRTFCEYVGRDRTRYFT